jgi:cell division protein FtsI/penicillin-binding protein 2
VKELTPERRRRLLFRALPAVAGLVVLAFAAGVVVGARAPSSAERTARDFMLAWQRGDSDSMYGMLDSRSQARWSPDAFRRAYRRTGDTATLVEVRAAEPDGERDRGVVVPVVVRTRVFGPVRGRILVPVANSRVAWSPSMTFPGLGEGEVLERRSRPPKRASLLAFDGEVLAQGAADRRTSPLGELATSIAGHLEPEADESDRTALYRRGFPRDWPVGANGLERAFELQLEGRPGGALVAAGRVIARAAPRRARPVRTTIDTGLQETAVAALAGRLGGIAAIDPRTGEIRALAGIAFSAPQPPGSTFKIVTATAALEAGAVRLSTPFPVQTGAVIDGVTLENSNGEYCGGTFRSSFAHSCNSVFAPLGVKLGSSRIVNAALRYGWNAAPSVPGEVPSTLPTAKEITTPLEVGSTAVGQGRVLATPLRMASVAQVVASGGVRLEPSLEAGRPPETVRVTSRKVARTLGRLMRDVVVYGTGTAAGVPGVEVAGKTGTAELEDTRGPDAPDVPPSDGSNTDAWFAAYAPVRRPRIALAVLLVRAGAGADTAAPAARLVLEKALAK